ncbi:adenylyltransferase/cytidyltransferase family protein [Patescibacteria group bacterium]|nr:adenylyltransferase/cytidyltransferase family protein [Patescibacteria group bacterium]MBU1123290.1 adenylyltransferase/cytidyltransferase family protein [Patescibacteria group bacterium]MBU1911689.1 adenylyltransferase/cytidyltransferase family protein [Patescibacteria group bacterium]
MKVLVFGTFDRLHPGHKYVLSEAQKRGKLFISVALDETVKKIKGKFPTQNQEERLAAIKKEFPQAKVMLGDPDDYLKPIDEVNPDMILLGYDQKLPPGISESDIDCPIERAEGFEVERYKSSLNN